MARSAFGVAKHDEIIVEDDDDDDWQRAIKPICNLDPEYANGWPDFVPDGDVVMPLYSKTCWIGVFPALEDRRQPLETESSISVAFSAASRLRKRRS